MEKVEMNVTGMHCGSCAMRVKLEVEDLPGIASVEADPSADRVAVEFDPEKTTPADIAAAVTAAGYTVVS